MTTLQDEERRARQREANRRWLAKPGNREKATAAGRRWRATPEGAQRIQELEQSRTEESRARHRETNRQWHADNQEQHIESSRQWKAENPERRRVTQRRYDLKRNYGMTPEEYDALLRKQDFKCAICGTEESGRRGSSGLAVDHDHKTGRVRGLLCSPCNAALGAFRDDYEIILRARAYLLERDSPDS